MAHEYLRFPQDLDLPVETRPPALWIWRTFLDLDDNPICLPARAAGLDVALHNLDARPGQWLPVESRPNGQFRSRLTADGDLSAYDVTLPGDLQTDLMSGRWKRICQLYERFGQLDGRQQFALVEVLCGLGLYAAVDALSIGHEPSRDPDELLLATRFTHARTVVSPTPEHLNESIVSLRKVLRSEEISVGGRLGAGTTLAVIHAQGRARSVPRVQEYRNASEDLVMQLRPDDDWLDAWRLSTFWRAVSFVPFLAGDHATAREELDLAESFARRLPAETPQQRLVRYQTFHPLLETRAKAAAAAGDLDGALRFASELRDHDPLDGKVHIQLGDVHLKRSDPSAAMKSYFRAAALGAPYHTVAWCKAAVVAAPTLASHFLFLAHRSAPASTAPLRLLEDLASASEQPWVAAWATGRLKASTERIR